MAMKDLGNQFLDNFIYSFIFITTSLIYKYFLFSLESKYRIESLALSQYYRYNTNIFNTTGKILTAPCCNNGSNGEAVS